MIFSPLLIAAAAWAADRPAYSPETLALVRQVTEVRLSPDGRNIAFVTDITGSLEAWTVPAQGGWPVQLSNLGQAVSSLRYSPDGKRLVFAADTGGDERPDLYLVDSQGGEVENVMKSTAAETSPRFSPDGSQLAFLADPGRPFLFQLMVMDLATRKARRLTDSAASVHEPLWSPDGRAIAVTRSGDDEHGDLLIVSLRDGSVATVAPPVKDGILFAEDYAASGKLLLCLARNEKGFMQMYLLDVDSLKGHFIGPGDWDVTRAKVSRKAGILFTRNEDGATALYRMTGPESYAPLIKDGGHIEDFDADREGDRLAYLWGDAAHPADVWVYDLKAGKKHGPVTQSLLGGVDPDALAKARLISYKSSDGREIHAWAMKPPVSRLGSPPPVVVVVHGGPNGQTLDEFDARKQALAEAGFTVLAPNYRGSTGYGREFEDADHMDWGGEDLEDLIAGVKFLAAKKEVDGKRAAITGGSYGGYMTLIALAKSNAVWAAGVEAYGMPDLVQDYELTKDRFGDWYETEMGTPMTHPQLFHDRSAINFLAGIKAPLMIFQGANDTNVPPAESELVYNALKKRGAPVELIVYPDEGHEFTRRKNLSDYYRRMVDFLVKTLKPKP